MKKLISFMLALSGLSFAKTLQLPWIGEVNSSVSPLSFGILLLLLGLLLIVAELSIFAGSFLSGLFGIFLLYVAVFTFFPENWLAASAWATIAGIFLVWGLFKFFPNFRFGKRLVLDSNIQSVSQPTESLQALFGKSGTAESTLRPAGTAIIGDSRIDVVTNGEYIEAGSPIKVVQVEGVRVVVSRV